MRYHVVVVERKPRLMDSIIRVEALGPVHRPPVVVFEGPRREWIQKQKTDKKLGDG